MKKQKVELYIEGDRQLIVRQKNGKEFFVTIFDGGGYYSALWLRTEKEIEKSNKDRMKVEKEQDKRISERLKIEESKKWYQFWK